MCPPVFALIPAALSAVGGAAASLGSAIPAAVSAAGSAAASLGVGGLATLAGTGLSAYGAIQQGDAQRASADAQAAALNNQAVATVNQGNYDAARKQEEINGVIGRQIAGTAASGVNLDGSPSDVVASTASSGALDSGTLRYNAGVNANNLTYQANLTRMNGSIAQQAGYIGALGTTFKGIADTTKLWQPYGDDNSSTGKNNGSG